MNLSETVEKLLHILKKVGLKEKTISKNYSRFYHSLCANNPSIEEPSELVISCFLTKKYGRNLLELKNYQMDREEQICAHALYILLDYQNTGAVKLKQQVDLFPAANELIILESFLSIRKENGDGNRTIQRKRETISRFLSVHVLEQLVPDDITRYLHRFQGKSTYYIKRELNEISRFLMFCFEQHFTHQNFQKYFPHIKALKGSRIPSVYNTDETKQLLAYFKNRKTIMKLRDYSIVLLISIYGFRASDIAAMTCEAIDFQKGIISITQSKTSKKICHRLLPHVGNAIVDYILNERPRGASDQLFLKSDGGAMEYPKTIGAIIRNGFLSSGISINGRKYGSHALRHSVASELINNETSIFTIANVLGQTSAETARLYAKVDISHLRLCALEVPCYE